MHITYIAGCVFYIQGNAFRENAMTAHDFNEFSAVPDQFRSGASLHLNFEIAF